MPTKQTSSKTIPKTTKKSTGNPAKTVNAQPTADQPGQRAQPVRAGKAAPGQPPSTPAALADAGKTPNKLTGKAVVHSSKTVYRGKVFSITSDTVTEPGGVTATRDVVRHGGSVVILAVDSSKDPHDPSILVERQYRHAAGQFLFELPAGRIEPGEAPLAAAKRELIEETGYRAGRWAPLVCYFASPGFLAESMQVFLAEDLRLGKAQPEEDERISLALVPLSQLLDQIEAGKILDGKTILSALLYFRTYFSA